MVLEIEPGDIGEDITDHAVGESTSIKRLH